LPTLLEAAQAFDWRQIHSGRTTPLVVRERRRGDSSAQMKKPDAKAQIVEV
jgi:hypothetical protein